MPLFYVFFVILPLLELWVFVEMSSEIGFFSALMLLFLSAMVGGIIVRYQGLTTLLAVHLAIKGGKFPLTDIFDGMCLVAAGALLILPGFLSDIAAFFLLIAPLRSLLRKVIRDHTSWGAEIKDSPFERERATSVDVIEGEYERLDDDSRH